MRRALRRERTHRDAPSRSRFDCKASNRILAAAVHFVAVAARRAAVRTPVTATSLLAFALLSASASDSIVLLPPKITLNGPFARQQVLIERSSDDLFAGQI